MNRISHDLAGSAQRIARLRDDMQASINEVQLAWKDEKGREFFQQHTSDIGPTLTQLVTVISETIELFEGIAKKVQDTDRA